MVAHTRAMLFCFIGMEQQQIPPQSYLYSFQFKPLTTTVGVFVFFSFVDRISLPFFCFFFSSHVHLDEDEVTQSHSNEGAEGKIPEFTKGNAYWRATTTYTAAVGLFIFRYGNACACMVVWAGHCDILLPFFLSIFFLYSYVAYVQHGMDVLRAK